MILDAFSKLETLKKERNAIILAHYYQDLEITLPEYLRIHAPIPLEKMLALS